MTVVVLIILATISVNAVIGQDGIIQKAKDAKTYYLEKEKEEKTKMQELTNELALYYPDKNSGGSTVDWVKSADNISVPVPKGYVASTVSTEKSVSSGFVIKEGTDGSKISGINEFVWVPVSNISDIYDEVNRAGQLWDFSGTTSTKKTYPKTKNSGNREPDVITGASEGVDSTSGSSNDAVSTNLQQAGLASTATASDFKIQLQTEFDDMIKSVKEYGGFYIGRYETGNLSQTKAVVQKNNTDIGSQTWYTMYKKCKTVKANDNVYTGMIWGCQWDATMRWMQTSTDSTVASFPTNSAGKGNYQGTNGNKAIPTGSNPTYAVNNIYDMAGNVYDFTVETGLTSGRVIRGGHCADTAIYNIASLRNGNSSPTYSDVNYGCRTTLYIK